MDTLMIQATRESVQEMGNTMLALAIASTETRVYQGQPSGPPIPKADVSAVVGMAGGIEGSVRLGCKLDSALFMGAALCGETHDTINEEIKDSLGELCNMIAGGVKTRMEKSGIPPARLTPPSIIVGQNHEVDATSHFKTIFQNFQVENHSFFVEIFVKP